MGNCPSDNTNAVDQSSFWDSDRANWDAHRIGWAVAGSCTLLTVVISAVSVFLHCRNYTNPRQQRQILRILYMPPVYGMISFLSFRYFRDYTYYSLVEIVYEAITLSAFLLLLIEFVADAAAVENPADALAQKEKRKLIFPLCCWRYRPTKAYFMYAVKWSVLQYVVVRPVISVIAIVCEAANVLCQSEGFNPHYANVYLEAIDFVSISIALYGLLLFYSLTKNELKGRRPLAKFLAIKLIVFFTFYQSFIFSALNGGGIHATEFWTSKNISNALNALAICIEMVFFSAFMLWAYSYKEYKRHPGAPAARIWQPLWDSINYTDFAMEIVGSVQYYTNRRSRARSATVHRIGQDSPETVPDFGAAFRVDGHDYGQLPYKRRASTEMQIMGPTGNYAMEPPPYSQNPDLLPPIYPEKVHVDDLKK